MRTRAHGGSVILLAISVAFVTGSSDAAVVSGICRYEGPIPRLKTVVMDTDPGCAAGHAEAVKQESLILGDGHTLANVIVRVKSGLPPQDYPVPAEAAVLDQRGCRYIPHVLVVRAGQEIKIRNSDDTFHNVDAECKVNQPFNEPMPMFRKELIRKFEKIEELPFRVKCDVHNWMGAWLAVLANPYFAVTGLDGRFSLNALPAGTYEIEAWHEKLGAQSATVTVGGDETGALQFTFTRP